MIDVKSVQVSVMATNCYLIREPETGKFAVIDPGKYTDMLEALLEENGVTTLEYIFLTHGHFDHIDGVNKLQSRYGGKIVIGEYDEICFTNPMYSLSQKHFEMMDYPEKADLSVSDGDEIPFGNSVITVMHTPGHTVGSVCYICDDVIFSGDTLFAGTCGRTDFFGGSADDMFNSLKRLAALDGDYKVYPGHSSFTTLDRERKTNGFMRV